MTVTEKKHSICSYILWLVLTVALSLSVSVSVCAAELPNGSVEGLPEKLVVLDDSGKSVSASGEYYFVVEDMQVGTTYTKKIQVMNLRTDGKGYRVSMRAEPLTKSGNIDLEAESVCTIYLDNTPIYTGKVGGEGTPDIRTNALDLGFYEPGQARHLRVEVVWNGSAEGGHIDNGKREVSAGGTSTVREASGNASVYGETTFKWIFYARVEEVSGQDSDDSSEPSIDISKASEISTESTPSQPSGIDVSTVSGDDEPTQVSIPQDSRPSIQDVVTTGDTIMYLGVGAVALATLILAVLLLAKKKQKNRK